MLPPEYSDLLLALKSLPTSQVPALGTKQSVLYAVLQSMCLLPLARSEQKLSGT